MGRSSFARYGQAIGVLRGCVFVMCSAKRCLRPSGVFDQAKCVFVSGPIVFAFRFPFRYIYHLTSTCPETVSTVETMTTHLDLPYVCCLPAVLLGGGPNLTAWRSAS